MAEVIKTILTADASELAAEFAKASAIAQKYAAERESQGNRALSAARAEVEALRLEAKGHGAAAEALREKIQLTEQARRLSEKTGVSQENALQILNRELALRKEIAAASAAAAVAQQRAARLSAPGKNGISLPEMTLTTANLQQMEKMQARANEVQRKVGQLGQGGKAGPAMGLLAVASAVEDAQYGIKGVINNIPQAVMAFGNFTPAAMRLAGGLSLVAVAGIAAYKAGYALGADQSVVKWAEAQTSALEAAKKTLDSYQDGIRNLRDREAIASRVNEERERENRIIERGLKLDEDRQRAIEKQREAIERKRAAEDAVLSAAKQSGGYSEERITSATRNLENKRAVEDAAEAQQRLNDLGSQWERIWKDTANVAGQYAAKRSEEVRDLEKARDSLGVLKSKQEELNVLLKNPDAYGAADRTRFTRDLENIHKQIAATEKLIAEKSALSELHDSLAKKAAEEGKTSLESIRAMQAAERDRIEQLKDAASQQQKIREIEDAARTREASEKQAPFDAAKRDYSEELEVLRARAAGENNRAGQLRESYALERNILDVMRQQNLTREEAASLVKERMTLEREQARGDFMTEMKALRMEASGDKKGADRLREESRIRSEAVGLAERLGIMETRAQSILRERARLEKEIASHKKDGLTHLESENRHFRHRIYTKTADEPRLTHESFPGRSGFTGVGSRRVGLSLDPNQSPKVPRWEDNRGLRNNEINRRNEQRATRPTTKPDDAAKSLNKSVSIQEEMLGIWRKLGAV